MGGCSLGRAAMLWVSVGPVAVSARACSATGAARERAERAVSATGAGGGALWRDLDFGFEVAATGARAEAGVAAGMFSNAALITFCDGVPQDGRPMRPSIQSKTTTC